MKKAEIIRNAIKEAGKQTYKWTYKDNKLFWDYIGESEHFIFDINEENCVILVKHIHHEFTESWTPVFVGQEWFNDCKTFEEGLKLAVIKTINKANNLY